MAAAALVVLLPALDVVPAGIVALGVLLGGLASLTALGIVLIWRAHRFLNLAHASMGLVSGVLVAALVGGAGWSFWLAVPVGLGTGAALGVAAELVLVGRLGWAPRPVLMAASLGLAYVFGAVQASLPGALGGGLHYRIPVGWTFEIFPVRFSGAHVLAVAAVPLCLAALAVFLRRSRYGIAVRAVAQDPDRARSLGVPARATSMLVWAIAGSLAAVGGILSVPILGLALEVGPAPAVLLLALAPAVAARMRSLPATVGFSLVVGVAYQSALWLTPRAGAGDLVLFAVVVLAVIAFPRPGRRREEATERFAWRAFASVRRLPAAVASRPIVRFGRPGGLVALTGAALAAPIFLGPADAQRLGVVAVAGLAAVSLVVVSGLCGRLSFGHWALVGVGAWAAGLVAGRVDYLVALGFAAAVGAAASVVIGLPSLRGGAFAYAVTTLAAAVAVRELLTTSPLIRRLEPVPTPRLLGFALDTNAAHTTFAVACLALAVGGVWLLRRRGLGRRMVALRDDETLALAHGVPVRRVLVAAYAISGALAGLAGGLYLHNQHLVHPASFDADRSLLLLAMVVVGGLGSVGGAVAGTAIGWSATLFTTGAWQLLGTGAGVLAVLLLAPGGLAELFDRARATLLGLPAPRVPDLTPDATPAAAEVTT